MRILLSGGGTGGHFFPLIAIAREIKRIAREEQILEVELWYMGPDDFGKDALKAEGINPMLINTGKWRRYASFRNVLDIMKIPFGILQAVFKMFFLMPDVIFSKGGYGALPAVCAAILYRIPFIIHESDAVPGKVNEWAAHFASRIGIAFGNTESFFPKEKTAFVGVPIRKQILGANREESKKNFGIASQLPVVCFFGASQGAQKINEAVLDVVKELTSEFEILHQTGEKNYDGVLKEANTILKNNGKERYHPAGFLQERQLAGFYAVCDLIVSRASASAIYEIAAWGKPAILIPLENSAQDHQLKNAFEYAAGGAAIVIEQENLTPHLLLAEIKKVLADPELMKRMGEAAQRFSKIESAELIAREIIKLGGHE